MNCVWEDVPNSTDARGWRRVRCIVCGLVSNPTPHEHHRIFCECDGADEQKFVGEQLKNILNRWGFKPTKACDCPKMIAKMNAGGIEWCREHREEIIDHLETAYDTLTWREAWHVKIPGAILGLVAGVTPRDACGALVDEAIRRAEAAGPRQPGGP